MQPYIKAIQEELSALALTSRLDLKAAHKQLAALKQSLPLARWESFTSVDMGVEKEEELLGPTVKIGVPLFNRGGISTAQLKARIKEEEFRIEALEQGDLKSEVIILGEDELAELSQSMNIMIKDINSLLENKHQLLLEVSHELRSPLARMQFLIEMLPKHKNNTKLREEVNFLESMIDNLLLSDRLSMPYSTLNLKKIKTSEIINKIMNLFPSMKNKVHIHNSVPSADILVDETKFIIALRNLLENAIKYSDGKNIDLNISKNKTFEVIQLILKNKGRC